MTQRADRCSNYSWGRSIAVDAVKGHTRPAAVVEAVPPEEAVAKERK